MSNNAHLLQWNCRGYSANYESIVKLLYDYSPSCFLIQETMLGTTTPFSPGGYSIHTHTVTGNRTPGDGLAVFIKDGTPFLPLVLDTNLQAMAFRIHIDRLYTICNIYIHPNEDLTTNQLEDLCSQLPPPYILAGDFNARNILWGDSLNNRLGTTIETFSIESDLVILNTGSPTHLHNPTNTYSAIDLTLCSPLLHLDLDWKVHDDLCGSDHFPITINIIPEHEIPQREPRFQYDRANWGLFFQSTSIPDVPAFLDTDSIDTTIDSFCNHIIDAATLSIPISKGRPSRRRVPWWNNECSVACANRKTALRRYQRTSSVADKISYQRARAIARRAQKKARLDSWRKYTSSLNTRTPMSKVWKRFQKMRGKYTEYRTPFLIENDIPVTDPREVTALLANHYATVSSNESYPAQFRQYQERTEKRLNFTTNQSYSYNSRFTLLELQTALSRSRNTAPGEDKISYQLLKRCHPSAHSALLEIYNLIWCNNTFPHSWTSSVTLSFHKPGKPISNKTSYRPISLTSSLCKLLEKIVNIRLSNFLESSDLLPRHQFGFRRMHSTTDALIRVSDDILNSFSVGDSVLAVFFDMQKAYDTTWRYGILREIHSFGMRGHLPIFIQNFLSLRTFRTKINDVYSQPHVQEQGVPQGSVLSCTLFSIAINGILQCLPRDVKGSLYVDDLLIYSSGRYFPALERRVQLAVNSVSSWARQRGFTFSSQKTSCVHFTRRRGAVPEATLHMVGQAIPCRSSARFLGMTFDSRLRWREHILELKRSASKCLTLLKCLSHTDWGADRAVLLQLYRAIIRSKLDYGCVVYGSASQSTLKLLDPVHHAAIRYITGAFRSSPVLSLYADSGEPPLNIRRQQLHLQFYARSMQASPSALTNYLRQPPPDPLPRLNSTTFGQRTSLSLLNLNIDLPPVLQFSYANTPVWHLLPETFCAGFKCPPKHSASPQQLRTLFFEHLHDEHGEESPIYTDGSKDGQSVGSAAVCVNKQLSRRLHPLTSIFTAELIAISDALSIISDHELSNFIVFSDSRSAIDAIKHYDSCHPIITDIINNLVDLETASKRVRLCWVPSHVSVLGNEQADREARIASQTLLPSSNSHIPFRDTFPLIKKAALTHWQSQWTQVQNNKLRVIKDNTCAWPSSSSHNKRHTRLLTRLRIGHTLLTHGHLMTRGPPPYCEDCLIPQSIHHILAECPSFNEGRFRFFPTTRDKPPDQRLHLILAQPATIPYNITPLIQFLDMYNLTDRF